MIEVRQVTPKEWKACAESAHLAVFDEKWDKELERIDFALIMIRKMDDKVVSYVTCQEIDINTVYLQYGGAFPIFRGTPIVLATFQDMLKVLREKYKVIKTYVENTNYPMLRFYIKENFLITGLRYFKEQTLLEHTYVV